MISIFRIGFKMVSSKHILYLMLLLVIFQISCSNPKQEEIEAVEDRSKIPGLTVNKVTTVISDSGRTKYRIAAEEMKVFDRSSEPYWEFKRGIYFERFDEKMKIDANFRSDYAKYLERKKLWEFKGKVKAIDQEGKMLETEQLFWDENDKRLYSDKYVKITLPNNVMEGGMGFEADERMTWWKIKRVQGDMYISDDSEI